MNDTYKPGFEGVTEDFRRALRKLEYLTDVEREAAAGVMREIAWVLWGDDALFQLTAHEIYAKFKTEVYERGISGLLKTDKLS